MHIVAGSIPYRYKRQKDNDGTVRLEERIAQNRTDQWQSTEQPVEEVKHPAPTPEINRGSYMSAHV